MPKERDIMMIIWQNFKASFKPRQVRGNLMGQDRVGNKYFEIPPNPSIGKRRTERWFEPVQKNKFDSEIPSEWEAWLRQRRKEPPSAEEIAKNEAIRELTQKNAQEKGYIPKPISEEKVQSFPRYEEYEIYPGQKENKDK